MTMKGNRNGNHIELHTFSQLMSGLLVNMRVKTTESVIMHADRDFNAEKDSTCCVAFLFLFCYTALGTRVFSSYKTLVRLSLLSIKSNVPQFTNSRTNFKKKRQSTRSVIAPV